MAATVRYIMTQPSLTKASGYARAELSYTEGGTPSYEKRAPPLAHPSLTAPSAYRVSDRE